MIHCPCGEGNNILDEQNSCPICGLDLTALHRLHSVKAQYKKNQETEIYEKKRLLTIIRNMKRGLLILPLITFFCGILIISFLQGPKIPEQGKVILIEEKNTPAPALEREMVPPPVSFIYTIKTGDTLSAIAHSFYGDSTLWNKIYAKNRDTLNNPDQLIAGSRILIPQINQEGISE